MNTNLQIPANKKKEVGLLYPDLSFDVVGLCYKVHNEVGKFAREKQYADLLEQKLKEAGIIYKREYRIGDTNNIVDFLIEDKIILELKAKRFIPSGDFVQTQRYLQATGIKLGILVNFGSTYVRSHRIVRIENFNAKSSGLIRRY
ncbi:MAG: hypothetical protein UY50_C0023G0018 [Parcubacteria group bacterium GW2011_GWA2_49_9]|nr:MAG: hypothetical protein UY50_C0023G0018 [Parcubacteria group bacterium GW2011_GWA2_49_9]